MLEHIVSRGPNELTNINSSCKTKDITTENIWTFELSVRSGINVTVYLIVELMQKKSTSNI